MKNLSAVRFGSYAVIVAIVILLQRRTGGIPVHFLGGEEVGVFNAAIQRRDSDRAVVGSIGFQNSNLSGAEIVAIAQKKARDEGQTLAGFPPPKIALHLNDGRIFWIVSYETPGDWPRRFEIKIEDATGIASYTDTTATL